MFTGIHYVRFIEVLFNWCHLTDNPSINICFHMFKEQFYKFTVATNAICKQRRFKFCLFEIDNLIYIWTKSSVDNFVDIMCHSMISLCNTSLYTGQCYPFLCNLIPDKIVLNLNKFEIVDH